MNCSHLLRLLRAGVSVVLFNFFFLSSSTVFAIPAAPFPFSEFQPDGSEITLYSRGDEHYNWMEDRDGYTVVRNRGWFEYAEQGPSGHLNPNGMIVGRDNPRAVGLQKHILPAPAVRAQSAKKVNGVSDGSGGASAPEAVGPSGAIKNLVVMIRFSDHTGRTLPSVADVDVLFNAVGGDPTLAPTGSVRDVYYENSYGQMTLNSEVNPGIGDWITVSNTEAYYANGKSGDSTLWQALREALDILDAQINFNEYDTDNDGRIDSIAFIHSGYGAEWGGTDAYGSAYQNRIWSHRWAIQPQWNSNDGVSVFDYHISPGVWGTSGSSIGRIGVISHETGHFFGLPDLYDTDSGAGDGIGSWGMMANSWGFNGTQRCPPHFSPWSKINLGWYTPTVITETGQYVINQTETNAEVYRINSGFPSGEYLLIENRQDVGFDCSVPQGGVAIWHIDDTASYNTQGYPGQGGWPENGNHYRVALLQADGNYNMERGNNRGDSTDMHHAAGVDAIGPGPGNHPNTDTYQGGNINLTGITISDISASGSSMTFCFNGCTGIPAPAAPTGMSATAVSDSQINLNWVDNADNEGDYRLERSDDGVAGWGAIASLGANSTSYSDTGLAASNDFFYRVAAHNSAGYSAYDTANATTNDPLPFVDYVAQAQSTSEGSVSGALINTHFNDGLVQSITERQIGGNARKSRSSLSHRWTFNVAPGTTGMTLSANAWSSGSSDGDDFQFQWSTDGSSYSNAFSVSSLSPDNQQSTVLPVDLSGTVYVRVIDTDNRRGTVALDTVFVNHLVIRADNMPVTPPADPSGLGATDIAHNQVDLSWNDNAGDESAYEVQRSESGGGFSIIATLSADVKAYSDTSVSPMTSYQYRVRALKGTAASGYSTAPSVTTPDLPAGTIVLNANGAKVKGKHQVNLSWDGSNGDNIDIRRNGELIKENIIDDGLYFDDIGAKGGATYDYEVCYATTSTCSNTARVVF